MLFNFDLMIVVLAIIVFGGLFTYTFYIIFTTVYSPFKLGLSNKFKLALIRLSSIGTVSTQVRTTVVELSDEELNQLLEVVFREIGSSKEISLALLQSLGLHTQTVLSYLESLGYIIIS